MGNELFLVTRIIPRILTIAGLKRMVGSPSSQVGSQVVTRASLSWLDFTSNGTYQQFEQFLERDETHNM
jgi:hypothetical protein